MDVIAGQLKAAETTTCGWIWHQTVLVVGFQPVQTKLSLFDCFEWAGSGFVKLVFNLCTITQVVPKTQTIDPQVEKNAP